MMGKKEEIRMPEGISIILMANKQMFMFTAFPSLNQFIRSGTERTTRNYV